MREENNGECFDKETCFFPFKRSTVPLFVLQVSSAVTEEFLLQQLPSLANQVNEDHFHASDFRTPFLAISKYEIKMNKGGSDTDPANTPKS